ncbi:MAG: HNH endonuclease [Bacteroidales bacterium]|nr:HNH endonuclease [Bacteroidales bacterium]
MIRGDSWTAEEEAWLREVYPDNFNDEIAEMHAAAFPDAPRRTDKAINSRAKVLKLRKSPTFNRNGQVRKRRTTWPPERVEWLRSFAPGHDIYEICDEFERLYGIRLSKGAMKNAKYRYGAKSGTDVGQFVKGGVPANKGRTWDEMGLSEQARANCRKNQFKKGQIPHNAVGIPVGAKRVDPKDGYTLVKVAEHASVPNKNDQWRLYHNVVWEEANGRPVPEGHMVVFADRDKSNFDPENLVLVPRSLWATISKMGYAYYDRASLEAAMNIARLDRARFAAQCRPRACRRCGEEFSPRYARQRTCDACLDAGMRAPRRRRA